MLIPYPFDDLQGMRMRAKVPFVDDRHTYYPEGTIFEVAGVGSGVELRPEGQSQPLIPVDHVSLFALLDLIDKGGNRIFLSKTFDTLAKIDEVVWKPIQRIISRKQPAEAMKAILEGEIVLDKTAMETNRLEPCQGVKDLQKKLKDVEKWCSATFKNHGLGESKHIVILVDEWHEEAFEPYRETFRRRAMHEDFWFFFVLGDEAGYHDIFFLPFECYAFTRHPAP